MLHWDCRYIQFLSPSGPWQDGRTSGTAVLVTGPNRTEHTLVAVYSGNSVALLHPH